MWRELFDSANHGGRRATKRADRSESATGTGERAMTGASGPARRADVSRETWDGAGAYDTPIGAAAERAMQVLHTNKTLTAPPQNYTLRK